MRSIGRGELVKSEQSIYLLAEGLSWYFKLCKQLYCHSTDPSSVWSPSTPVSLFGCRWCYLVPFSKSDHARIHCFQGQILVGSVRVRRNLTPKQKSNGMRVVPHRLHRRRHPRGTHKYSSTNQCISHPSSSRTRPTLAGTSDGPVWEL